MLSSAPDRAPAWLTPARFALLAWLISAILGLAAHWSQLGDLRVGDADDALRIVQIRDLAAGQAWWDVGQYRINPLGGGGVMHWSRIVDAPLVASLALLTPLVGQALAETVVFSAWPLMLMLALFLMAARLAHGLGGRSVAFLSVGLLMFANMTLFQFQPLRVDHHGWQILLALGLVLVAVRAPSARRGLIGGGLAATQIAISIEGLPYALLFAAIIAFEYAWNGQREARSHLIAYLFALASVAAALLGVTRGLPALMLSWCDALSAPYLAALGAAAVAVSVLTLAIGNRERFWRFAMLAVAAAISAAALLAVDPSCAAGPFGALDPMVQEYWYLNVREGLPAWQKGDMLLAYSLAPSLVGLVGSAMAWRASGNAISRRGWLIMLAALAGAIAISLLVLRTAATAHLFALPGSAWLAIYVWRWARARPQLLPRIGGSLLPALALPPVSGAVAAMLLWPVLTPPPTAEILQAEAIQCNNPAFISSLNQVPSALLFAPLDIGPHILLHSHHSVIATGHHRNQRAMRSVIDGFLSPAEAAKAQVRATGARYLVVCDQVRETEIYRSDAPDGLAAALHAGDVPGWLEPVPLSGSGAMRLYRIAPPAMDDL